MYFLELGAVVLHGDGVAGLEPEGVGGAAAAGAPPVGGGASCGEAVAFADGVLDLLRGADPGAVPDRPDSRSDRRSVAVVEPMAGGVPPAGGAAARRPAVLNRRRPEAGVRMLRSVWAPT